MSAEIFRPRDLTAAQRGHWEGLLAAAPHLDSPYLHPDFSLEVDRVRSDARVAWIDGGAAIVAFQKSGREARPMGGRLSDFQAVIADPSLQVDPQAIARECGVPCWKFDHLLDPQGAFSSWTHLRDGSPYIDLSRGFGGFVEQCERRGAREWKETLRKSRKLEREEGPVTFQLHEPHGDAFECLLRWKSKQYRKTRITDVLARPWAAQLLRNLGARESSPFRGVLSSLRANGKLVAVHFGLLSNGVLHYWFPAYDEQHARHSPGRVLLIELARRGSELGIRRIDLGRGMARYKLSLMSGVTEVCAGAVELRSWNRAASTAWRRTRSWLRQSPLRHPLKFPARAAYRLREWMEFR